MADSGSDASVFSSIFDSSADGVMILAQSNEVIYWNPRMEELFGISSKHALGEKADNLILLDQKTSFLKNISCSFKGIAHSGNIIFTSRNDRGGSFTISFSPIDNQEDKQVKCLVHFREVSTEFNYLGVQAMIRESPLAMALYASDGTALHFNEAFIKFWDVPFSAAERTFHEYNIFGDEQLSHEPVRSMIRQAFNGEMVELPVIPYNPARTESLKQLDRDEERHLKGYMFPLGNSDPGPQSVLLILQDMTEHKKSEDIVMENEQKFKLLSLGLPGVIYEYHIPFEDKPAFFNYVSQGIQSIFKLTPEQVTRNAATLFDLVHPNDLQDLQDSLHESEQVDNYWEWSGRFVIGDEIKWIEAKSSPGVIMDDRIIRYGLITDITDRMLVEDAHKRTEERLRVALEAADLGFWEWDVREERKIFNSSWAQRFGYTEADTEALYRNWEILIHPDDLPGVKKKLSRYLRKQSELYEAEYRFRKSDGTYRWIHDRGSGTAMDSAGKIIRATGTYVDIHEKKESENRIQRQEQLFSHLFRNSPIGIVFLDEDMIVREVNPGFSEIFGYRKEDIVNKRLRTIIVPEDLMEESDFINKATREGRSQKLETYRLNADNEPVPVIIYSIPVIFQDQTIGIYGLYVDITDRVKVEKELEIRNLELDNFVYKVSHDLRAPLSSIMGLVNLVHQEKGSESVYEYIDMIENRIKQLDHFISDILSHSKNLKMEVKYGMIDFHEIIEECFNSVSYLPQSSRIKKVISIQGGEFYSDQWRISEILRNLVSNAVKYYSGRRDEPFIEIDILVERTYASIYFGDNGIGIPEDRLPKVFEMFYRATEYGEGSGIGLYIVKNAIERLGGVIRIKSEANKGTSFEITLPNAIRELD